MIHKHPPQESDEHGNKDQDRPHHPDQHSGAEITTDKTILGPKVHTTGETPHIQDRGLRVQTDGEIETGPGKDTRKAQTGALKITNQEKANRNDG